MTRHGRGDKSDGTAAVTAGTAPANVEATAASMNEAMASLASSLLPLGKVLRARF